MFGNGVYSDRNGTSYFGSDGPRYNAGGWVMKQEYCDSGKKWILVTALKCNLLLWILKTAVSISFCQQ